MQDLALVYFAMCTTCEITTRIFKEYFRVSYPYTGGIQWTTVVISCNRFRYKQESDLASVPVSRAKSHCFKLREQPLNIIAAGNEELVKDICIMSAPELEGLSGEILFLQVFYNSGDNLGFGFAQFVPGHRGRSLVGRNTLRLE